MRRSLVTSPGLLVERDVEIDADQDLLAVQVAEVGEGFLGHDAVLHRTQITQDEHAMSADQTKIDSAIAVSSLIRGLIRVIRVAHVYAFEIMYFSRSTQRLRVAPLVVVPATRA